MHTREDRQRAYRAAKWLTLALAIFFTVGLLWLGVEAIKGEPLPIKDALPGVLGLVIGIVFHLDARRNLRLLERGEQS